MNRPEIRNLALSLVCLVIVILLASVVLPPILGYDWRVVFRPAALATIEGQNPYQVDQFMIAPWSLLLFVPLALLPERVGLAFLTVVGLLVYALVAIRLGTRRAGLVAILLSPQVLQCLINGNIDWLALAGFVMPAQIGLFFLALKPQIGAALMVYWALEAIREKRFWYTFFPFIVVLGISFTLFGFWPLSMANVSQEQSVSMWPLSLPFGLVLLFAAIRRRRERLAQGISPLIAPHVMFHSWAAPLFALAPDTLELIAAVVVSWLAFVWILIAR